MGNTEQFLANGPSLVFYLAITHLFTLSSKYRYQFSVGAILTGFIWFLLLFSFTGTVIPEPPSFFTNRITESNSLLQICLLSASVAYLILLVIPSFRLYQNWRFVQQIKKQGLSKAEISYRLFVQKISAQLGIRKKVWVYISDLVHSPVTVGYLKPVILLPLAAVNQLSTLQVEAILLHELSHIRRFDYLINLVVSIINTILYFNPFVRLFMRHLEEERENCCDQMVLQYGYDKIRYASALLCLERSPSSSRPDYGSFRKRISFKQNRKNRWYEKEKRPSRSTTWPALLPLFSASYFSIPC
jgi:bla regulator protein BlaR1